MQDHDLDDLIIDNINPKNSKTKNFLTIIALGIVMLIIAIILTQIILKKPSDSATLDMNNTELLGSDLTLLSISEENVKAPLIPTVEEIKPIIMTKPTLTPQTDTVKISNDFALEEENKRKALAKLKQEKEKIAREKREQEQIIAAQKKEVAEKAEKEKIAAKREAEAREAVNREIINPYFIQVGSFSQTPSQRFLSVIKTSGFNYQITAPSSSGSKKLLIGPYTTKLEAIKALSKVKDRINKSAYIIRK